MYCEYVFVNLGADRDAFVSVIAPAVAYVPMILVVLVEEVVVLLVLLVVFPWTVVNVDVDPLPALLTGMEGVATCCVIQLLSPPSVPGVLVYLTQSIPLNCVPIGWFPSALPVSL